MKVFKKCGGGKLEKNPQFISYYLWVELFGGWYENAVEIVLYFGIWWDNVFY